MDQPRGFLDRFGRRHTYLRVSVTDRCNLRCLYCMPAHGLKWTPNPQLLTFDEITRLCRIYAGQGVNKIRLTGGEPTVRAGLEVLIAQLADIPGIEKVFLTTNGLTLARMAKIYQQAGIAGVNISLDSWTRLGIQKLRGGISSPKRWRESMPHWKRDSNLSS